jgi:hypothetical protein
MAENLTKDFINLSSRGLSPYRTPELSLYHREGGLDIRPLVVVLHKGFLVEVIEVPHSVPQPVKLVVMVALSSGVSPERYVCCSAYRLDCPQIPPISIGFISGYLIDVEGLSRLVDQSGQLSVVSRCVGCSLGAGNDMGLDTADKVGLYPSLPTAFLAVLVVEPSGIDTSGEARGVNGEVGLNRPQRAGGLLDESLEQRRQFGILKVTEGAGEGRRLDDQPPCLRFPQVGHKSPAGHSGIDLSGDAEHDIRQRQSWSPEPVFWLGYAVAEVSEQGDKMLLLVSLSLIIGRPLLGAGHFDRLCVGGSSIRLGFPLYNELNGVDVFAGQMPCLKVGAGAERLSVVKVYDISPVARLGGHFPAQLVFLYLACVGYYKPSFLSCVHFNHSILSLLCAYYTIQCIHLSRGKPPICENSFVYSLLTSPYTVWYNPDMENEQLNDIQTRIAQLQEKGWTLAAIADELEVTPNAVEKWKAGDRNPSNQKATLMFLDKLLERKRIPKRRRYINTNNTE